ncbi:MAG: hypothetical protein MRY21_08075 [Simkaniaceae bacterium]|nr:hypothetical protein [Simkaniaceae bacterium]
MNIKRIIGIILVLVGLFFLGYGFYGVGEMSKYRKKIDKTTGFIPNETARDVVGGELHAKVDEYNMPVALCFIGGVVLVVIGGATLYYGRKK